MANDWNKPDNSTDYADVLGKIRDMLSSLGKMVFTGDSNIPTGFFQWNDTKKNVEKYNGSSFDVVGSYMPVGAGCEWYTDTAPSGFLLQDGSEHSQTTYADLFAVIGTTFNTGGETPGYFRVPDRRERFPIGKADSGDADTIGNTGGSFDHTHTISHTHSVAGHYHGKGSISISSSGSHNHSINHNHGAVTSSSSGSHTHTSKSWPVTAYQNYLGTSGTRYWALGPQDGSTLVTSDRENVTTSSSGSHTHSVDLPNYSGNSGSTSHSHSNSNFSGSVGNTSGSNGDSDITTGGASNSNSGSANPPYLVVNYIIKH